MPYLEPKAATTGIEEGSIVRFMVVHSVDRLLASQELLNEGRGYCRVVRGRCSCCFMLELIKWGVTQRVEKFTNPFGVASLSKGVSRGGAPKEVTTLPARNETPHKVIQMLDRRPARSREEAARTSPWTR